MRISDLPHHVLALYGEIDNQVLAARKRNTPADREIVDLVETMLPGTTGFGQAGWYRELEKFADKRRGKGVRAVAGAPEGPVQFPEFSDSVLFLERLAGRSPAPADPPQSPEVLRPKVQVRQQHYTIDRDPVYAKATFAAVVLEKIRRVRDCDQPLSEPLNNLAPVMAGWLPTTAAARNDEQFRSAIATDEGRITESETCAGKLAHRVHEINDRQQYREVVGDVVSREFADISKSCFGTLEESGGLYCSTLYTDHSAEDLSVNDIARIVHPLNWPHCSGFFGDMELCAPRYTPALWDRILEVIGAERDEYCLSTSLIFDFLDHRDADPSSARGVMINYDLDPNRDDDGIVEVDNGYIWITAKNPANDPDAKGVRIRSSKQERINGLSPTATSALGCLLGWGQAAEDMLSGTARRYIKDAELRTKFEFVEFPTCKATDVSTSEIDNRPASGVQDETPLLPPNFGDTVDDVRDLLNNLVDRTAKVAGDGAARWLDGLGREEVRDITKAFGTNLSEWADLVYETAERNVIVEPEARVEKGAPRG